ncbi:hypothetical protein [Demequina litorisediminis]|uniref:hypothetical protein n=1 Tax=Demequina litorisediminis TaxID=1849022 RepID=UPI0024E0B5F0|nr:hypothetical protein [Demequina litorisediminis]
MDVRAPRWIDAAIAAGLMVVSIAWTLQITDVPIETYRLMDPLGWTLMAALVLPLIWRQSLPARGHVGHLRPVARGRGTRLRTHARHAGAVPRCLHGGIVHSPRDHAQALRGPAGHHAGLDGGRRGDARLCGGLLATHGASRYRHPAATGHERPSAPRARLGGEVAHARREQAGYEIAADAVRAERARIAREPPRRGGA